MPASTKKTGLGNPALVAASTPAGQKAMSRATETQAEIAKAGIQLIPTIFKTLVIVGVGYWAYNKITNRFEPMRFNSSWPAANISQGQAAAKANAIYAAMSGPSADAMLVATQLQGLNYNGWVMVYNAFGKQKGWGFSDMDLVEWINDQFSNDELQQLRFVLPGVF